MARAVRPAFYWRSIGLAEPVRPGRILLLLAAWWLLVRAAFAVPLVGVLKLDLGGGPGASITSILINGWDAALAWRYYSISLIGGIRRLWEAVSWDTDDSLEVFFISLWPVYLSLAWLIVAILWYLRTVTRGGLARHLVRAFLMSLLIFPVVHESIRLLTAFGYVTSGQLDGRVILVTLVASAIAVSYWWRRASKTLVPEVSTRFFVYGNLAVIVVAPFMHIATAAIIDMVLL